MVSNNNNGSPLLLLVMVVCTFVLLFVIVMVDGLKKSKKEKSLYEILEVEANATQREIRKAYFALVKIYHPDKNEQYEEKKKIRDQFELISNAYEILSDDEKKAEYDRQLELGNTEFKPTSTPASSNAPKDKKPYKFKDPMKAYEDALKKEEEEAFKEKVINGVFITFGTLVTIFGGFVLSKLIKRTRVYQKYERQIQDKENRKNLAEKIATNAKASQQQELENNKRSEESIKKKKTRKQQDDSQGDVDKDDVTEYEKNTAVDDTNNTNHEEKTRRSKKAKDSVGVYCMPCKKLFKSIPQWENHQVSKKHRTEVNKLSGNDEEIWKQKLIEIDSFVEEKKQEENEESSEEGEVKNNEE